MKPRITVLTLGVADLERAMAFYRDGLGFATDGIIGTEFEGGAVAFFDLAGGLKLALWGERDLANDVGNPPPAGRAQRIGIGHNVASPAEVDAVLAQAVAAGGTLRGTTQSREWGGYTGYFEDLDGHLWEVVYNPDLIPED